MPIYPSARQWYLFAMYQRCPLPLHPVLFLQDWVVSYSELSKLTGVSQSTVEHWFTTGVSHREPAARCCRRLAIIDYLWRNADRITPEIIQSWCHSTH